MKTTILFFFFFSLSICFSQTNQKQQEEIKPEEVQNEKTYTTKGVTFKIGDTLTFDKAIQYIAIVKGIKRANGDLVTEQVTKSLKNTKCIIYDFKNKYGLDYTYCKSFNNADYRITLDVAIALKEVEFIPPRVIPKDYVPFSFQGVNWKTTKNELIQTFPNINNFEDGYLLSTEVAGLSANLLFSYFQNNLNIIGYVFNEVHSSENLYIEDYLRLKGLLIEKYGEPINDKKNWRNSLYKDDYEDYGLAISIGHLEYLAKWELPDTDILLKLSGDNYKIKHILVYYKYPKDKKEPIKSDLNKL